MRLFFLFLSSLLAFSTANATATTLPTDSATQDNPRYTFQIETPKGYVSGIMITDDRGDELIGSMVNEFGVSALDFAYSRDKDKVRILNAISFLNKWYIKRVLSKDIRFCLHIIGNDTQKTDKNYEVTETDNTVTVLNKKRKIKYTFSPLSTKEKQDESEE